MFNFGNLKDKDETNYIESMVTGFIKKIFENEKNKNIVQNLVDFEKKCIKICHNYLKANNDISIVSLREVNRFNIFLEFFFEYIKKKRDEKTLKKYKKE